MMLVRQRILSGRGDPCRGFAARWNRLNHDAQASGTGGNGKGEGSANRMAIRSSNLPLNGMRSRRQRSRDGRDDHLRRIVRGAERRKRDRRAGGITKPDPCDGDLHLFGEGESQLARGNVQLSTARRLRALQRQVRVRRCRYDQDQYGTDRRQPGEPVATHR